MDGREIAARLAHCEAHMVLRTYEAGEILAGARLRDPALHVLKRGSIRLFRVTDDGREVTLDTVRPPGVFGRLAPCAAHATWAQALTTADVCVLGDHALERLAVEMPGLVVALLRQMSQRIERAEARAEELAYASATQRVARALLRRTPSSGRRLRISQSDLSKDAGVARETASRVLSELQVDGVVVTSRRSISVVDPAALEARSRAAPRP